MDKNEITLRARDNCILLYDLAGSWESHRPWAEKQSEMAKMLSTKEGTGKVIGELNGMIQGKKLTAILRDETIASYAKTLQARVDAGDYEVGGSGGDYKPVQSSLDAALRAIEPYGNTIVGLRMVEEHGDGDPEKLAGKLTSLSGRKVSIREIYPGRCCMREKTSYLGKKIWIHDAAFPAFVIWYEGSDVCD